MGKMNVKQHLWSHERHCRLCGKEFYITPEYVYKDDWGVYCSWKCFNHRFDKIDKNTEPKERVKRKKTDCKPINQYTLEGDFIRGFSSAKEAAEAVGTSVSFLRYACCYGRICKGYLWRYKEDELPEMQRKDENDSNG